MQETVENEADNLLDDLINCVAMNKSDRAGCKAEMRKVMENYTKNGPAVSVEKHVSENPDSLEIGTPAKGGAVKIYHTFADAKGFKEKIDAALEVRTHARAKLGDAAMPQ